MKHRNKQTVQLESIPSALKQRDQWVMWRHEQRYGKTTKVPYRVGTLTSASTADSTTWGTYNEVVNCLECKNVDGIGFVFTSDDPFVGVDLDNSLEPETHTTKHWASGIIEGLASYTEISPSGCGVKVILEATKEDNRCRTPEHMLQEIEFTGERASAIVNESRFLDNALGLTYQKGTGIANLIQMWDGDSIEYGRKSDGLAKVYEHPVLTMCVCMTPEKFEGKYRRMPSFVDEGFGQRFLYIQASVPLKGKSAAEPKPAILNAWGDTIRELASMEIPQSTEEKPQPHLIHFDDEAEELLDHLSNQIADKLTVCRARLLPFWASWNTRILANIIRIAGILHAVRHGPSFVNRDICLGDAELATSIMKFYCSQAETVINGTSENEIERVQGIIRKYLDAKKPGFGFSLRDLNQKLPKTIRSDQTHRRSEKIQLGFEALVSDGFPIDEHRDGKRTWYERR
jgi:Protein of unknown function (DUF3987)